MVDPGELLRSSESLKKFVGRNPKMEPPDRENPDTPWEYDCESRVTKILRSVTIARRNVTNTVNDLKSRLKLYQGDSIGNITTQMDSLTKDLGTFNDCIQEIRSSLTTIFEMELDNLVHRIKPDPEGYISMVHEIMSMLHQQESLVYMIRRERVESSVAQIFLKWEGKNREEKASRVVDRDLTGGQQAESVQGVNRMLDAQMGRISWSMWS